MGKIEHTAKIELRLIYQICVNDIENIKRRQWSAVYYIFLSFAAIIGLYHLTKDSLGCVSLYQRPFLYIPGLGINFLGIWILMDIQKRLFLYRKRTEAIEKTFSSVAQEIYKINDQSYEKTDSAEFIDFYFWSLILPFIILMMIGCFYVLLFLGIERYESFYIVVIFNSASFLFSFVFNYRSAKNINKNYQRVVSSIEIK